MWYLNIHFPWHKPMKHYKLYLSVAGSYILRLHDYCSIFLFNILYTREERPVAELWQWYMGHCLLPTISMFSTDLPRDTQYKIHEENAKWMSYDANAHTYFLCTPIFKLIFLLLVKIISMTLDFVLKSSWETLKRP